MNKSAWLRNKIRAAKSGWGRNRTADTRIFSPLLCQLSYPAATDADLATCLGFPLCNNVVVGQAFRLLIGPAGDPPPRGFGVASAPALQKLSELRRCRAIRFRTRPWHSLCRLDLRLQSAT